MFGKRGVASIYKEMKQFDDRNVVRPLERSKISRDVRKKALGYLMFLKEKRSGEIKARGCADGRPQKLYTDKMQTSSPTVATESIFMTSAINAKEGRDVAVVDIPGAFLQTKASDGTVIELQGTLVNILVEVDLMWKKYVVYEGKKKTPTI